MSKYLGLTYLIGLLSLALVYQNCGEGFSAAGNRASFSQADQSPVDVDINDGNTDLGAIMNFDSRGGEGAELPSHLVNRETDTKDQGGNSPSHGDTTKKDSTQDMGQAEEQMQVPNPGRYNFVSGQGQENCQDLVDSRLGVELECTRGGGCGMTCGIPGKNCPSANPQHYGLCVEVGKNGQILDYTKPQEMSEVSKNPVTDMGSSAPDEKSEVSKNPVTDMGSSGPDEMSEVSKNPVTDMGEPKPSEPMTRLYPFFEISQHNHILVTDPNELSALPDYLRLREVINIYTNGSSTRVPIYRCRQDLDAYAQAVPPVAKPNHFVSNASDCEGQIREAVYGFVETRRKTSKYWPLYRLYHPVRRDHVVTFEPNGYQRGGYQPESIIGYVELP